MSELITDPAPAERARILGEADPAMLSAGPNSLADPQVREDLVRGFYADIAQLRAGYLAEAVTPAEAVARLDGFATKLQSILFGEDPDYTPVSSWNDAAHLGVWLHERFKMEDDGPRQAVRALLITNARDLLDGMAKHASGEWTEEDIQTKADGLVEETLNAIAGVAEQDG